MSLLDNWQNLVGIAGFLVAVGSLAFLGLMRERMDQQGKLNDDLDKRVDFLEKQHVRDEVEKTEMQGEIARLKDREEYLATLVRDRANYAAFNDQLDDIHRIVVSIDRKVGR